MLLQGLVLQSCGVRSPHSSPLSLRDLLVTTGCKCWDVKGECSAVCQQGHSKAAGQTQDPEAQIWGIWKDLWVTLKSHYSSTCILNPEDSDDSRIYPVPKVGIKAVQLRKNTEVKGVRKAAVWLGLSCTGIFPSP